MLSLSLILNCNHYNFKYFRPQLNEDRCWHDVEWKAKEDRWCNYEEEDDYGRTPCDSIYICGKNDCLWVSCNMVYLHVEVWYLDFFSTWRDKSIFLNVILVAENWHILNTSDRCVYTLCTRKRRDSCSLVYEKYTNCLSERIQERVRFLPYIINNSVSFFASA